MRHFLPYKNSSIAFHVFGKGAQPLFCLHGYGDEGSNYSFFEKWLGRDYCIIVPDLPFHGQTDWQDGNTITPNEMLAWITSMQKMACPDLTGKKIHLLGYSMGGRLALRLFQEAPDMVEKIILVCPDGLHQNFWHYIATQTRAGNFIFEKTMHHPNWLFLLMNSAYQLRLLNKSIFKFAHHYLDDPKARDLLYKRWTLFRKFVPEIATIKKCILHYRVPMLLVFGAYDRIILSKRSHFIQAKNPYSKIYILHAGHQLMREKYGEELARIFYQE